MKTIEQKFFEVFNIPADKSETAYFTGHLNEYPKITDSILLQLICIFNEEIITTVSRGDVITLRVVDDFKDETLKCLIKNHDKGNIHKQVRKLFGVKDEV